MCECVSVCVCVPTPNPDQVDEDGGLGSSWGEWMIWGLPTPLGALACPTPISGPPDGASVTGDAVIRARGRCVQYTARCVQYTAHVVYVIYTVCPRRGHWPWTWIGPDRRPG